VKITTVLASASLAIFAGFGSTQEPVSRPNIVVFLVDDMGMADLAVTGHPTIRTPHLDQMAREGIRFTSFY